MKLNKFDYSILMYDKAIQIHPNDSKTYLNKGINKYMIFIMKVNKKNYDRNIVIFQD